MPLEVATKDDLEPILEQIRELSERITIVPEWLTYAEVKQYIIKIDYRTIEEWVSWGEVTRTKIGKKVVYERDSIREFLKNNPKYRYKLKTA